MTEPTLESIIVERVMPHSSAKIWRALTETTLLEQWLMHNDFQAVLGQQFEFRRPSMPGWNGITKCQVLSLEPPERLVYTWNPAGEDAINGLKTLVIWTLTPVEGGTLLRMEHSGFTLARTNAQKGTLHGWTGFFKSLEQLLTTL